MFTYAGHAPHVLVAKGLSLGIWVLGQSVKGARQVLALLLCNLQGETQHEWLLRPANQLKVWLGRVWLRRVGEGNGRREGGREGRRGGGGMQLVCRHDAVAAGLS